MSKKKELSSKDANESFLYRGNDIVKLWQQYLKSVNSELKFYLDSEQTLASIFTGITQNHEVALVLNSNNSPYLNKDGYSLTLCGEVNYVGANSIDGINSIKNNLSASIAQIKSYNDTYDTKITNHIIIFPYHAGPLHWNLGKIELVFAEDSSIIETYIDIYEPFGGQASGYDDLIKDINSLDEFQLKKISRKEPVKKQIKQQYDSTSCGTITAENGKEFLKDRDDGINLLKVDYKTETRVKELRLEHINEINEESFFVAQLDNIAYEATGDKPIDNRDEIIKALRELIQKPENDWIKQVILLIQKSEEDEIIRKNLDLFKQFLIQIDLLNNTDFKISSHILKPNSEFKEGAIDLIKKLDTNNSKEFSSNSFNTNVSIVKEKCNKQKQEDLDKVAINCKNQIISEIDKILKILKERNIEKEDIQSVEENLSSSEPSSKLSEQDIRNITESLYRISWRSSEVPTQIRFGKHSPLTEKTWIRLDYLSNVLVKLEGNDEFKKEFFQNILSNPSQQEGKDLVNSDDNNRKALLKTALNRKKLEDNERDLHLPTIEKFVAFFYDQYLLERIQNVNNIFKNIGDNFFVDEQKVYGFFRGIEILGECFKNLSNNVLSLFPEKTQDSYRELRNMIQHNRPKLQTILEYDEGKNLVQNILEQVLMGLEQVEDILKFFGGYSISNFSVLDSFKNDLLSQNIVVTDINFEPIDSLTRILNTKSNLSSEERKELFKIVSLRSDRLILNKIILGLENIVSSENDLNAVMTKLEYSYDTDKQESIKKFVWKANHKIPLEIYMQAHSLVNQNKNNFNVEDFRNKLIQRINTHDKEIISLNEINNSILKIVFKNNLEKEILDEIKKALVMSDKKYKDLKNSLDDFLYDRFIRDYAEWSSVNGLFELFDKFKSDISSEIDMEKAIHLENFLSDKGKKQILLSLCDVKSLV